MVGGPPPSIDGVEVIQHRRWTLQHEISLIHQFDVGVMPLPDTPWTRGKCAYKLIQCMACGIPVIASPVGANVDAVPPACGFLFAGAVQWLAAFRQLATYPALREEMDVTVRSGHLLLRPHLRRRQKDRLARRPPRHLVHSQIQHFDARVIGLQS